MKYFRKIENSYEQLIYKCGNICERLSFNYAAVFIYKILLDVIYCKYIADSHAFFSIEISVLNIVNGWITLLLIVPFLHKFYKQKTCSAVLMTALNMIYFIPITTYCGYGGGSSSFLLAAIIYWLILSILQIKLPVIGYDKSDDKDSSKIVYLLIILVSVVSIFIWWKYSGFRIHINILDVYSIRDEAAESGLPSILSYMWHMMTIVVPILIVLTLHKRKYILVLWLLFLTLINFSYAGNKSVILFPIILIGGYIFYRKNMISLIFPLGIFLEIMAVVEQKLGSIFITSYFFRRQGMVLAQLSENYYRFFLENPTDIFRSSIMGKFGFNSIYNNTLAQVIGNNFETQTVNCNNGLLADVWANLGIIGLIVMPIIIIICFRILDFVSYKIDLRLMIGLVLYYAMMFANTTWSTVLLTHGFIVMCLMLLIFPHKSKELDIGATL